MRGELDRYWRHLIRGSAVRLQSASITRCALMHIGSLDRGASGSLGPTLAQAVCGVRPLAASLPPVLA